MHFYVVYIALKSSVYITELNTVSKRVIRILLGFHFGLLITYEHTKKNVAEFFSVFRNFISILRSPLSPVVY